MEGSGVKVKVKGWSRMRTMLMPWAAIQSKCACDA